VHLDSDAPQQAYIEARFEEIKAGRDTDSKEVGAVTRQLRTKIEKIIVAQVNSNESRADKDTMADPVRAFVRCLLAVRSKKYVVDTNAVLDAQVEAHYRRLKYCFNAVTALFQYLILFEHCF
jgi:hypothetical protein